MESFEAMYNNLTSLIRENVDAATFIAEYSKLLETHPGMESRVRSMLDSAFGEHGNYKTAMGMFEQGRTHFMTEMGRPDSGEMFPYSNNHELSRLPENQDEALTSGLPALILHEKLMVLASLCLWTQDSPAPP